MGAGYSRAVFRTALIISASLALAGCNTPQKPPLNPLPVRISAPSGTQEIPLADPVVDLPVADQPQAPQIASMMLRRPPGRKASPLAKGTLPKDAAPEPETVVPSELVGFDFPAVLQVLRRPDTVQNSALSVVWTYSQPDCMLQLFFYPDIQTKTFHLLKYDLKDSAGEKPNDTSMCMRRIARNDEPTLP